MQHVLKMREISLLPKYTKRIPRGVYQCVFASMNAGL